MPSLQPFVTSSSGLQLSIATVTALRTSSILTRKLRTQQTRNFRLGLWTSYLDPNYEKELQRRHRIMRHKCAEAINRKLSWDRHFPKPTRTNGLKTFMCSAWRNLDSSPGGRWLNIDELRNLKDDPTSQPTEAKDKRDLHFRIQRFKASLHNTVRIPSKLRAKDSSDQSNAGSTADSSTSSKSPLSGSETYHEALRKRLESLRAPEELEYTIDPITNRKVYKPVLNESMDEETNSWKNSSTQTFRFYRSKFQETVPATEKRASNHRQDATPTREVSDPVQDGLRDYDSKVNHYAHGALYDVTNSGIDYTSPGQAGFKDCDQRIGKKAGEMGVRCDKTEEHTHKSGIMNINETQHSIDKSIHHYEATVSRPKALLKAIQEYEAKRPRYSNGVFKQEEILSNPLFEAIQAYETSKANVGRKGSSVEKLDPLLKLLNEYHDVITVTRNVMESKDKRLEILLKPIEQYRESLVQIKNSTAPLLDGLKDYDSKVDYSRVRCDRIFGLTHEDKVEDLDLLRASDIRAASGRSKTPQKESETEKSAKRKDLEIAFQATQEHLLSSEEESMAFKRVKELRNRELEKNIAKDTKTTEFPTRSPNSTKKNLTGNFVRDFPEEFQRTWQRHESGSLVPKPNPTSSNIEGYKMAVDPGLNGNPDAPRLETALDRSVHRSSGRNPLLHQIDGKIEGSEESLTNDIQNIYERKFGVIDADHRQVPSPSPIIETAAQLIPDPSKEKGEPVEPILYKILAYDPTMQSVSEAETTSMVEDSKTPMTPADVLLRLGNPSKFFPYFQPLRLQGFEILCGSGDVLVFRKVRPSVSAGAEYPISEDIVSAQNSMSPISQQGMMRTNPVDGMQTPYTNTGDFASPTGFINHDLPRGSDPPYNIDVRREEPIFSGKSNWAEKSEPKPRRKGRAKRVLVTGVWVAGCCYAVGVVTEFFRNGPPGGMQGF